ncbi:MAG: V-type ATP synthase subunit D [Deltaproteobacteria bacterium]
MRSFQYNKTELLSLRRELAVRLNALPTLKNKEAALRAEVLRFKTLLQEEEGRFARRREALKGMTRLWSEFPPLVRVGKVRVETKNIAGVKTPMVAGIDFIEEPYSRFSMPAWFPFGVELLKELLTMRARLKSLRAALATIETARRKTTQKVNLYEKVQIPAYEDAMRRIKRFLEDEENISKSSQKILKKRLAVPVAEAV